MKIDKEHLLNDLAYVFGDKDYFETLKKVIENQPECDKWISVQDGLPNNDKHYENYIVTVIESFFPDIDTSLYSCDAPYTKNYVTTALYDSEQKIWYLGNKQKLNAMLTLDDLPLNCEWVSHYKHFPKAAKGN